MLNGAGNVLSSRGDLTGAIAFYSEAIEINPKYYVAHNNRGIVNWMKGNLEDAITDFTRAIELHPTKEIYYNRGNAYLRRGNADGAIADFTKAIEINSRYAEAYLCRGISLLNKGDLFNAQWDIEDAIDYSRQGSVLRQKCLEMNRRLWTHILLKLGLFEGNEEFFVVKRVL